MISSVGRILIFLSVCGVVISNPDRAIDCRKFVFAPLCRGVAAKRDSTGLGHYELGIFSNEGSGTQFLKPFPYAITLLGQEDEEENQLGTPTNRENLKNIQRTDQQERNILKLLFGNKKINSERDNFFTQQFENL